MTDEEMAARAGDADTAAEQAAGFAADGDHEAALTAITAAIAGYRALAALDPEVYDPDLAAALDTASLVLGTLGRPADALVAARESVALFRDRAQPGGAGESGDAALFLPYLAAAMSNLSVRLHEAGDDTAALETAREAASLFRDLATPADLAAAPAAPTGLLPDEAAEMPTPPPPLGEHSPGLAAALGNLANRLDEAHRGREALVAYAEAAAVYQQLVVRDPDRFRPPLARITNNRAVLLRESGETAVAISTTRQAVNIYRSLAATRPEIYRDYLAMTLGNLANMLGDAGRGRDALGVAQEAAEVYRQLAADAQPGGSVPGKPAPDRPAPHGPAAHGPTPAPAASTGADVVAALAAGASAGEENPYHAPLAMSLNNLAVMLAQAHRTEEALTATREATALYRSLARRDPHTHLGNLAGTLTNLGSDLAEAGRASEALSATREAVDVTRRLAFGNAPVYTPQLAQAVGTLALRLQEAGRSSSALASAREAVRLYEELATRDPDRYEEALTRNRELASLLAQSPA